MQSYSSRSMVNATPGPADTKRCQSFAGITFHHFMNKRNRDSATGSAYRMTECDRTTIDIDPTLIPFKHLANRKRLCSKRFISLDKIDISQLPANTLGQRRVAYTGAIPSMPDPHQRWQMRGCGPARVNSTLVLWLRSSSLLQLPHRLWMMHYPLSQNRDYQMKDLNGLRLLRWCQCVAVHRYQQPTSDRYFGLLPGRSHL